MKKIFYLWMLATTLCVGQHPTGHKEYASIPVPAGVKNADAELEAIRQKIRIDLLGNEVPKETVLRLISEFNPSGTWKGINYQDISRTGFEHRIHLSNVLQLAQAHQNPVSPYFKKKEVFEIIDSALAYWIQNDFICDNWWWNEMGTPNAMIAILLVMDEDLSEEQRAPLLLIAGRANMKASGARPGGDLIQIAGMRAKQALYQRNHDEFRTIVGIMASEIKTTTGRGMKPDLSFHHRTDNVISTLTYGTGYTNAFAYWAVKNAGTAYALPEASLKLLVDHFIEGINASMAFSRFPDPGAKNRELSRRTALNPVGPDLAVSLRSATSYRKEELDAIIKLRKGEKAAVRPASRFFWHSEYFTFQSPTYFSSVRMHSSRNHTMEFPHNEEGLRNHHFADGSNFLIRTGTEYSEIFPVWDWQKIPGTTVLQKPELPHWKEIAKTGKKDFTGGVTDGRNGAAAFDFSSVHDPVSVRKSWFFFDDEYVCLGTGLTADSDFPVVTTLDQRLLSGPVEVLINGAQRKTLPRGEHPIRQVEAVVHEGVKYVFTKPQSVLVKNQPSTGNWRNITHQSWASDEPVQKDVFLLSIQHPTRPTQETYAYKVIPNATVHTPSRTTLLAQSDTVHAVADVKAGLYQAVFFAPGRLLLPNGETIHADTPCMLLLRLDGTKFTQIAVSDPSRKLEKIKLRTSFKIPAGKTHPSSLVSSVQGDQTVWRIDLPQNEMAGQSVAIAF
jgi:chondroitin AC lyase